MTNHQEDAKEYLLRAQRHAMATLEAVTAAITELAKVPPPLPIERPRPQPYPHATGRHGFADAGGGSVTTNDPRSGPPWIPGP